MYNEELDNFYSLLNIIWMIKQKRIENELIKEGETGMTYSTLGADLKCIQTLAAKPEENTALGRPRHR